MIGITTRDEAIGVVREHRTIQRLAAESPRAGKGALHFGIDDAVTDQPIVLELVMPPLLAPRPVVLDAQGMEHGVEIDRYEVLEITVIARRHGIDRAVRPGRGVQIGRHRALQEFDERLFHRITIGPTEHGMLKDVRHARIVDRRRLEGDAEGLVVIGAVQPDKLGPVPLIDHLHHPTRHFGQILNRRDLESANLFANRHFILRLGLFFQHFSRTCGTAASYTINSTCERDPTRILQRGLGRLPLSIRQSRQQAGHQERHFSHQVHITTSEAKWQTDAASAQPAQARGRRARRSESTSSTDSARSPFPVTAMRRAVASNWE